MSEEVSILVVEDSRLDRELFKMILTTGPYVFELIDDGQKAYEKITRSPAAAIVVTDVNLPGLSGIDLIKLIRANDDWSEVPIIAMSSKMDQATVLALKSAGSTVIMSKPYNPERLLQEVLSLTGYERTEA